MPLNGPSSAARLEDAFNLFNEMSEALAQSYRELEGQVLRLTEELAAARSERLQTLMEKAALANRLQRLLEALPGGVVVLDGAGQVAECNRGATELLGTAPLHRPWSEVLAEVLAASSDNPHQRRLTNGRYVSFSASSLGEEPGQIILLTDVSEMHALQGLVEQQQRLTAMGEMLAGMAHQIRTPLAAAVLYASHLGGELPEVQRKKFSDKLLERLRHLERQVNDMLVFARAGRYAMEKVPVRRLLERAVQAMEAMVKHRRVEFRIVEESICPDIYISEDAFLGALTNLMANAVEALGDSGLVTLSISRPEAASLRISVIDNGPGMSEDVCRRVFQPFFTTRSSGTGLGLAVVECVVRAHGGSVSCESAPGQGAQFHIDLPLVTEPTPLAAGTTAKGLTVDSGCHESRGNLIPPLPAGEGRGEGNNHGARDVSWSGAARAP
ncbi:MAG: PAS domain-containing protein [Methylococcaceae bacterium]|nr:MAG: PAS domain-containing protein [Methylococcaceae bacterium]